MEFLRVWWRWVAMAGLLCHGQVTAGTIDEDFVNPPVQYKSRPLWFWNGTVTKEGIEKQMEGSVASGYCGFGILPHGPNPRLGFTAKAPPLEPPYQSEAYYQLYKAAADKAEQLGMKLCVYDEYNWPSGTVGGRLAEVYPEAIAMRLSMKEWIVAGPVSAYTQSVTQGLFEAAVAMNMKTHERTDISDRFKDGRLTCDVPPGTWKVMVFTLEKGDKGVVVNYLEPDSVDRYIQLSLQPYYDRLTRHFGKTIDSVFYDEPNFNSFEMNGRNWTRNFQKWFTAARGFNPVPLYPALFMDVGPDTDSARYELMHFRAKLFSEGYAKRMQDWGDAHGGIALTGHMLLEQMIQPTGLCGDLMLAFKHQKIPGVDEIGYYGNAHEVYKVISSAAYNWDKELVMTEIYGASAPTEKGLYQSLMSEYAKGINLCIPHAVWNDPGRGMFSPELSFRDPKYGPLLPAFNDFVGRCQRILQGGRHVADIAVVYPIANLNASYDFTSGGFGRVPPEADYQNVGEALSFGVLRDFTYLHPEVLEGKCSVTGDVLRLENKVNWEDFKILILPGSRVVNVSTMRRIKEFYDQGGKVIFTTKVPEKSAEPGYDTEVRGMVKAILGEDIYGHNEIGPIRFDPVTAQKVRLLIRSYNYGMPEIREFSIPGVAERGTISASDEYLPWNGATKAADGDLKTYWRGAGQVGWNERWLQIEFKESHTFDCARVEEDTGRMSVFELQYWKDGAWHACLDSNFAKYAMIERRNDKGGKAIFLPKPHPGLLGRALDSLVPVYDVQFEEPPHEVEICKFGVRYERSGWFSYIHKFKEGRDYYFIANAKDEGHDATIRIRGKFVPRLMFPATGKTMTPEYTHLREAGVDITRIRYAFKPVEAVFITSAGQAAAGRPLRIMCVGDSITAGYTDNPKWTHPFEFGYRGALYRLLKEAGIYIQYVGESPQPFDKKSGDPTRGGTVTPEFDLRDVGQDKHRGYGGWNIVSIHQQIEKWIEVDQPDVILLMIGINGIGPKSKGQLSNLVETIYATAKNVTLVVAQITPKATFNQDLLDYNTYIRETLVPEWKRRGARIATVDHYRHFLKDPADPRSIDPERLSNRINHPDNPRYKLMAQGWCEAIQSLIRPAR